MADSKKTQIRSEINAGRAGPERIREGAPTQRTNLPGPQAELLNLQRAAGNEAVSRLLQAEEASPNVPPAEVGGTLGDLYRHHADADSESPAHGPDIERREKSFSATWMEPAGGEGQAPEEEQPQPGGGPESQGVASKTGPEMTESHPSSVHWGRAPRQADADGSALGSRSAPRLDASSEAIHTDYSVDGSIAQPREVSWGAARKKGGMVGDEGIDAVIVSPTSKPLSFLQGIAGMLGVLGVTSRPSGFKAPDFAFKTVDKGVSLGIAGKKLGGKSKPLWYALPKQTTKADEGSNISFYVGAGVHKRGDKEGGIPVFINMSAAMAQRNFQLESEHPDDHRLAFEISLKEAEDVLQNHVDGKTFGPEPTEAAAKQLVLDAITKNLKHPQLSNDQTKWGAKYQMLSAKTVGRDKKGWHSFFTGNRTEVKNTKGKVVMILYDITKGTTKLVPSAKVVKY